MYIRGTAGAALAALAVTLVLGGCGGDESEPQVASLGEQAPAETTPSEGASEDPEEAMLAFAQCLRKQGIDVPDPGDGPVRIGPAGGGRASESERREFERANKECRPLLEKIRPPELDPEDRAALQDGLLNFARCMREHGVDVPDPDFSGNGGAFRIGPGNVNPDDPDFQAAQKACRKHLRPLEEMPRVRRRQG
jgi:hypothetical protein